MSIDTNTLNLALSELVADAYVDVYQEFFGEKLVIVLDGHFSLEDLKAIVTTIEAHKQANPNG